MKNKDYIEFVKYKDDFGIDEGKISAFSRTGLWDHDPKEHLNIHSSHQIITTISGIALIEDGKVKQPLYRNMAAFIPAGTPHRVLLRKGNIEVGCNSLFITPDLFPLSEKEIEIFRMEELSMALLKKLNEINLMNITDGLMGDCLRLFLRLLPAEMDNKCKIVRIPEVKNERNKRIADYIRENYMNKLSLHNLSHIVPLSIRQLARSFQDEVEISIMEYLRLCRLLQASLYLYDSDKKIIHIALDCGYNSLSTFHEDFKHHFGLSPNRFRAKLHS